jgi:hypothetical protein
LNASSTDSLFAPSFQFENSFSFALINAAVKLLNLFGKSRD